VRSPSENVAPNDDAASEVAMTTAIGRRASVLLVEDEPAISDVVAAALEEQGFEVHAVATAAEALRCLNAGTSVDVLFTDLNLPGGMDGAALAQRARELRPGLAVMYTSGRWPLLDSLDPVEGAMAVPKPYDPFYLGRLLEYLVGSKLITNLRRSPAAP
jgi:CheY-like chemotaxis protein